MKRITCFKSYLPIIKKGIFVLFCSVLILSCSKDDNDNNSEKEHEEYSDDSGNNEYEGYKMSKHYFSVDDVSTSDLDKSTLTDNDDKIFRVKKGLDNSRKAF